jgi:hypothetical protein
MISPHRHRIASPRSRRRSANEAHLKILRQGVEAWNVWRENDGLKLFHKAKKSDRT